MPLFETFRVGYFARFHRVNQHASGNVNSELITSSATASSAKLNWTLVAALVYLSILLARVWGAQRFLHFEESVMVAASRSLSFGEVWNDNSYGGLIQRGLAEFSTLFALSEAPMALVSAAVLVWFACAMSIYLFLQQKRISNFVALVAPLSLCLTPMPDGALIGLVSGLGFPLGVIAGAIASFKKAPIGRRSLTFEIVILFVIASSTPTGLVGAGVAVVLWLVNYGSRRTHLLRISAIFAGTGLSAVIARIQEPTMTYIGDWVPDTGYEREVFVRFTDAGAFKTRERASVGLIDTIQKVPGTLRFIITQFYPEPWASRAILETGGFTKLLQVVLPLLLVIVMILACMRRHKIDSAVMRVALGLFLAAAMSVIVQHILVGQLGSRQYLFLPLVFFWMAILVLFSGAVVARSGRAMAFILPLAVVFAFTASQNFRDPFQENPRQGGTGRYSPEDLWRPALKKAQVACENLEDDEVVVISQFDPESAVITLQMIKTSGLKFAWFDHPFVARCHVINGQ